MSDGAPRIAALLLAAGLSRRMGGTNKLLATVSGRPLVRIAAEAALASRAHELVVVTGHEAAAVEAALAGLAYRAAHNPDFVEGMATSLRAGIGSLGSDIDGTVVLLADMPAVTAAAIDAVIAALAPGVIVVPTFGGVRGNPVGWWRDYFVELAAQSGDRGGRDVISRHPEDVREIALDRGVALDVDTPEALAEIGAAGSRNT